MGTTLVFYDGVCGLCDRLIRFLIRRDVDGRFRFAALQGQLARTTLRARGYDPSGLDTVYVVRDWNTPQEQVLERSGAVLCALSQLGGGWRMAARVGGLVPVVIADGLYRVVARTRYRLFGRLASCPLPPAEWRQRFLDRSERGK